MLCRRSYADNGPAVTTPSAARRGRKQFTVHFMLMFRVKFLEFWWLGKRLRRFVFDKREFHEVRVTGRVLNVNCIYQIQVEFTEHVKIHYNAGQNKKFCAFTKRFNIFQQVYTKHDYYFAFSLFTI